MFEDLAFLAQHVPLDLPLETLANCNTFIVKSETILA